ncbi:MAG: chromosomal protein MC1 [Euryarchaeota archaeon]|nr:chromosomal protein MC1 [Euryarchaeota archaeon]
MARRKAKRHFVLLQGKRQVAVFTGRFPRSAALKAAAAGYTDIVLRERGRKTLHKFKGSRKKVRTPENRPAWLPVMAWQGRVRKVGTQRLEKVRGVFRR